MTLRTEGTAMYRPNGNNNKNIGACKKKKDLSNSKFRKNAVETRTLHIEHRTLVKSQKEVFGSINTLQEYPKILEMAIILRQS